ncbi:MAG: Multi-copper polyphenol oxidoreductase laccase [Pseudomonadota bacterium]
MSASIESGVQSPWPLPDSWLHPTWDFAFPMHEPEARAQASRLAERYMVLCSNRHGGVSEGVFASMNLGLSQGDRQELVAENRKRLAQYLPAPARYLRLVH